MLRRRSAPMAKMKAMRGREMMMAKIDTETIISAIMLLSQLTQSLNFLVLFVFLSLFYFTCIYLSLSLSLSLSSLSLLWIFFLGDKFSAFEDNKQLLLILALGLLFWILVNKWENVNVEKFKPRLIELTSFKPKLLIRLIMNKTCEKKKKKTSISCQNHAQRKIK